MHLSDTADSHMWWTVSAHSDRVSPLTCKQLSVQGMVDKSQEGCVPGYVSEELDAINR